MTHSAGKPDLTASLPGPAGRPTPRPDRRLQAAALSVVVAGHVGLFMVLSLSPTPPPEPRREDPSVTAMLIKPPPPPPPPVPPEGPKPLEKPSAPAPAAPVRAQPATPARTIPKLRMARTPPPPEVPPLVAVPGPANEPNVVLGDAALAGATVAGSGSGQGGDGSGGDGGQCDMVRRLQDALRGDPDVTAAVTRTHRSLGSGGKAILVWNGQWLRSPGQDGKGLAGVRQAIAMEVAFAPPACKTQPMRGLVVISFNDGPGAPRLALGSGTWRWSELLSARR